MPEDKKTASPVVQMTNVLKDVELALLRRKASEGDEEDGEPGADAADLFKRKTNNQDD